jgi:hypothetical protein
MRSQRFACAVVAVTLAGAGAASAQPTDTLTIANVRGDVYRIQMGRQTTMMLVAPDGIFLADALTRRSARELKARLEAEFPNRPVRYVAPGDHRFDRAEGASVFRPTASIVGPKGFNDALERARAELEPTLAGLDADRSGTINGAEFSSAIGELVREHDSNGDGVVTPGELYANVEPATSGYTDSRGFAFGDVRVELFHPEMKGARDLTIVMFAKEGIVFSGAGPDIASTPFSFGAYSPDDVMAWFHMVLRLKFDTLVMGTGDTLSHAEVVALSDYLEALWAGVREAIRTGKTLSEAQAAVRLEPFEQAPQYPAREAQIADVYQVVRAVETDLSAAAIFAASTRGGSYCLTYDTCSVPATMPGVSGALTIWSGRLGGVFELTFPAQTIVSRTTPLYDEEFARRESRGTALFRVGRPAIDRASAALLGGVTMAFIHTDGRAIVKGGFAPYAGRHPLKTDTALFGLTGGVDIAIPMKHWLALSVPVRVTWIPGVETTDPMGGFSATAGIGLRVAVLRVLQ